LKLARGAKDEEHAMSQQNAFMPGSYCASPCESFRQGDESYID
jgi:hypothetical protein